MHDPLLELKRRIISADSMTSSLREWCEEFGIGEGSLRSDHSADSGNVPPNRAALDALQLVAGETVRHRGITLMRGNAGLLDADNWYVPERLPAETNRLLEETDTPFGAAVPHEGQARETLFIDIMPGLRAYLDEASRRGDVDKPVIVVRAIVTLSGVPASFVEERLRPELFTPEMRASV